MAENTLTIALEDHPAYRAWTALGLECTAPGSIARLGRKKKSAVFRLASAGPGGCAVVAKRCCRETAAVERIVYSQLLHALPVTALQYYGFVDEPDSEFSWIFIEDAGDKQQQPQPERDGSLMARWLGSLHAGAANLKPAAQLPPRGPSHYFKHLQAGRDAILQNLGNPLLRGEDIAVLKSIVAQCDFVEARRSEIESFCEQMPHTLVHGDFVVKNMRLRTRDDIVELVLYDWETSGWGAPAADVAELLMNPHSSADLARYSALVRIAWPHIGACEIQQLAAWGRVFRLLAMVSWESTELPYQSVRTAMGSMRYYHAEMARALAGQGWNGAPAEQVSSTLS
jgi:hypothetical protein